MKACAILFLAAVLAACAAPDASREPAKAESAAEFQARMAKELAKSATTPLRDLNLVTAEIPPALVAAQKGPYLPPADQSCEGLAAELAALDSLLGPDLDSRATPANPGLLARGVDAAGKQVMKEIRGTAERAVPYRRWVRKLSGAERYSQEVAAAIAAGAVRRSFLKGVGYARGCLAPAAPAQAGR